jgi:hypothetical protein
MPTSKKFLRVIEPYPQKKCNNFLRVNPLESKINPCKNQVGDVCADVLFVEQPKSVGPIFLAHPVAVLRV